MTAFSNIKSLMGNKKGSVKQDSPYLTARRSWNDHTARLKTEKFVWQLVGIISLLIALSSVGGIIYIGQQSKFVPYIVQVDKLGKAVGYAQAQRASAPNQLITRAEIADFIAASRIVTPDSDLQRKAIFRVYAKLAHNDSATAEMNEFYMTKDAFERAKTEVVSTEIRSVMPQTNQTWEVEWIETVRDRSGVLKSRSNWRALVTVYHVPVSEKTTEAQLLQNPTGLFVRDFSWSKRI